MNRHNYSNSFWCLKSFLRWRQMNDVFLCSFCLLTWNTTRNHLVKRYIKRFIWNFHKLSPSVPPQFKVYLSNVKGQEIWINRIFRYNLAPTKFIIQRFAFFYIQTNPKWIYIFKGSEGLTLYAEFRSIELSVCTDQR